MIAIGERDYSGTYEGTVLWIDEDRDSITINCPDQGEDESNWRVASGAVWDANPIRVGDPVRLYVEFERYRVVGLERPDLDVETLRDCIKKLEDTVKLIALRLGIDA